MSTGNLLSPLERTRNLFQELKIVPPEPPTDDIPDGEVSFAELHCEILSMASPSAITRFLAADGSCYPQIVIPEARGARPVALLAPLKTSSTTAYIMSILDSIQQRLRDFVQSGADENNQHRVPTSRLQRYAHYLFHYLAYYANLQTRQNQYAVPASLRVPSDARVLAFGWHKYRQKFSVALQNNVIHTYDIISQQWSPLALSHEFQKDIFCLEWKPLAGQMLAVGCGAGVCVWNRITMLETSAGGPTSIGKADGNVYSDQAAWMTYLAHPEQAPVNTIAWSPNGRLLAAGSANSGQVIIWDVFANHPTVLPRVGNGIISLKWSPTGDYLFAASSSAVFTIWETRTWKREEWSNFNSYVQSAAWSGDGKFLALSIHGSSEIHFLHLPHEPPNIQATLLGSVSMAQYEITTRRGVKTTAGGKIYELAWDPTSSRLVVSFADNNLIAVMQSVPTKAPNQFVDLIPLGYLRGPPDSGKPTFLTFCPTPPPFGALLSVCWQNGKIIFYPMHFKSVQRQIFAEGK